MHVSATADTQRHGKTAVAAAAAHLYMRESALADALHHLQLLLAQHDVLVIVLVIDGAQRLARVIACQQRVQPVLARLAGNFLGVSVIADVLLIFVPLHGHTANCERYTRSGLKTPLWQELAHQVSCTLALSLSNATWIS